MAAARCRATLVRATFVANLEAKRGSQQGNLSPTARSRAYKTDGRNPLFRARVLGHPSAEGVRLIRAAGLWGGDLDQLSMDGSTCYRVDEGAVLSAGGQPDFTVEDSEVATRQAGCTTSGIAGEHGRLTDLNRCSGCRQQACHQRTDPGVSLVCGVLAKALLIDQRPHPRAALDVE